MDDDEMLAVVRMLNRQMGGTETGFDDEESGKEVL